MQLPKELMTCGAINATLWMTVTGVPISPAITACSNINAWTTEGPVW